MRKEVIISVIKEIEFECNRFKDGGNTFIKKLSKKLENTNDEEKMKVLQFFLDELIHNENDMWDVGLLVIVELKEVKLAPEIFRIYQNHHHLKDNSWKDKVIMSLMQLKYVEPKVYLEYINDYVKRKETWYYYDFLLLYFKLDKNQGIPLLINYFIEIISKKSNVPLDKTPVFIKLIDVLTEDELQSLISKIFNQNNKIGNEMCSLLMSYFQGSNAEKLYSGDKIKKYKLITQTQRK